MANDLWGGGGGGFGDGFDDDFVPGLDRESQLEEQTDLRAIEELARAAFRAATTSPRSDGVSGTAPTPGVGAARPGRNLRGYSNAGKGRRGSKRPIGVAGPSDAGSDARLAGEGAGHDGRANLEDAVEPFVPARGGLPTGVPGPVTRPEPSLPGRRGEIRVLDRLGTKNQARGYKKPEFSEATVHASVKDLKFTTSGDLELRLTIPYEYRDQGQLFADAWGLEIIVTATRVKYGPAS